MLEIFGKDVMLLPEQAELGGLELPKGQYAPSQIAKVTHIGSGVNRVKVGDRVIFDNTSDTIKEVEYRGKEYLLMREIKILAKIGKGEING